MTAEENCLAHEKEKRESGGGEMERDERSAHKKNTCSCAREGESIHFVARRCFSCEREGEILRERGGEESIAGAREEHAHER